MMASLRGDQIRRGETGPEKVAGLGLMTETFGELHAPFPDLAAMLLLAGQYPSDGRTDRLGRERIEIIGERAGHFAEHRNIRTENGCVGRQRLDDRDAKT